MSVDCGYPWSYGSDSRVVSTQQYVSFHKRVTRSDQLVADSPDL